ncbi:polysaccharide biosynthesis/export family protein [Sphingomonas sp.]|uniref:polysaccharide biosynthesis/export family protein n=1 Tax=Sphingomonas sp. TaxID=28214 RepID=UPI0038A79BFD
MGLLAGCASVGASGPSTAQIVKVRQQQIENSGIKLVDVTDSVARQTADFNRPALFSQELGDGFAEPTVIGPGDVIDISIIEAPPAVLFSSGLSNAQLPIGGTVRPTTVSTGLELPQQMVDLNGRITVPFAGSIQASGRTPQQIGQEIVSRLRGKAHDPQAIVRRVTNASSTATVLGEVGQSGRIPLTAKGERILDVLATAGGAKQPISKSVVQITRGDRSLTLPLTTVISDGRQNIVLQPNDVVTVYYQPYSFTVLGATGTNAEVPLEGTTVTLSQALGRVGGLQDNRADIRGVFVFRFEDPKALDPSLVAGARVTADGKIPVIYRVDLKNPATLLVAQTFPIKNKDVLYVANTPLSDLGKFVGIVSSMTYSLVNLGHTVAQ